DATGGAWNSEHRRHTPVGDDTPRRNAAYEPLHPAGERRRFLPCAPARAGGRGLVGGAGRVVEVTRHGLRCVGRSRKIPSVAAGSPPPGAAVKRGGGGPPARCLPGKPCQTS